MQDGYNQLIEVLSKDKRFLDDEGKLLKNKVQEYALKTDEELLKLLLSNNLTRSQFFVDIDGIMVFDKNLFSKVVESRDFLKDSYTKFSQNILLVDEYGVPIKINNNTVLDFPYKDCILEGGQTKDDKKNREEVFLNEVLAFQNIDKLLAPKVFCNAILHKQNTKKSVSTITNKDNLLIKGNNLLVLSSLLPIYQRKIKLIYLDPPYNTGSDEFSYNDSFNRSTWLTFMKNRLELCKSLLSDDGAIYVQLDYHQVHYAKVLMDEIFGENNFQREIIWRIGWLSGYKTNDNNWIRNHDTILFYSKNSKKINFNKKYINNDEFKNVIKHDRWKNIINPFNLSKEKNKELFESINYGSRPDRYPIEDTWNSNEYDDLNSIAIVSFAGETVSKQLNPDDEVKGQKPEKLIKRIIEAHCSEGDIVLDCFAGSGTTAATAHKMGLNYIICEQLDKHIDISIRRLTNVINGDSSGISKEVNWKGGGSFISVELASNSQNVIDRISKTKKDGELSKIYEELKESDFVLYRVDMNRMRDQTDAFAKLSLEDKKKFLISIIDKNTLYINYSDINNQDYKISKEDKEFTESFYKRGNE